jgi:hypothetical protein
MAAGVMRSEAAPALPQGSYNFQAKHVIWIINGNGSRKKEYYESPALSPNYTRLAKEGFVYTESHNETVSNHGHSWTELLTGNRHQSAIPLYPTPAHYVRKAYGDAATNYFFVNGVSYYRQWRYNEKYFTTHPEYGEATRPVSLTATHIYWPGMKRTPSQVVAEEFPDMGLTAAEKKRLEEFIEASYARRYWEFNLKANPIPRDPFVGDALGLAVIPDVMQAFKPRLLIYQQVGHDTGHGAGGYLRQQTGYFEYEKVCKTTDEQLGRIIDFVKNDPYFSKNTAIVIRPEFGRDDEVNMAGAVNHSEGYYQCHRSAEIWWGPDFKVGVSNKLVNRLDMVPSITKLFNVDTPYSIGQVHPEMFKTSLGKFPDYQPYTDV